MALRRLAGNRDLITANLIRSLSGAPPFSRSFHHDDHHLRHPDTQIPPPSSRPTSFSNVFDPLSASTRSGTQAQLMTQRMGKCSSFASASGIMGIGKARVGGCDVRDMLHLHMYKFDGFRAEMKRSFSSSVDSSVEQSKIGEKMHPHANITRPLSPHLPIYKPQTNSVASIFNRISGAYLAAIICVFYLLTMKVGVVSFTFYPFYQLFFYSSKFALISAELAALALAYHVFHSLPHVFADFSAILKRKH